jgi:hypothetical protein
VEITFEVIQYFWDKLKQPNRVQLESEKAVIDMQTCGPYADTLPYQPAYFMFSALL